MDLREGLEVEEDEMEEQVLGARVLLDKVMLAVEQVAHPTHLAEAEAEQGK